MQMIFLLVGISLIVIGVGIFLSKNSFNKVKFLIATITSFSSGALILIVTIVLTLNYYLSLGTDYTYKLVVPKNTEEPIILVDKNVCNFEYYDENDNIISCHLNSAKFHIYKLDQNINPYVVITRVSENDEFGKIFMGDSVIKYTFYIP